MLSRTSRPLGSPIRVKRQLIFLQSLSPSQSDPPLESPSLGYCSLPSDSTPLTRSSPPSRTPTKAFQPTFNHETHLVLPPPPSPEYHRTRTLTPHRHTHCLALLPTPVSLPKRQLDSSSRPTSIASTAGTLSSTSLPYRQISTLSTLPPHHPSTLVSLPPQHQQQAQHPTSAAACPHPSSNPTRRLLQPTPSHINDRTLTLQHHQHRLLSPNSDASLYSWSSRSAARSIGRHSRIPAHRPRPRIPPPPSLPQLIQMAARGPLRSTTTPL